MPEAPMPFMGQLIKSATKPATHFPDSGDWWFVAPALLLPRA